MHYLSVDEISKQYGEKPLFRDISFGLDRGDKIALIAKNGAGKSTLLNILANFEEPDSGKVVLREGVRMMLLPQEPDFDDSFTVEELVKVHNTSLMGIIREYETALSLQAKHQTKENEQALIEASSKMDIHQAWDYERRLSAMLQLFNLTDQTQLVATLSGGQKKRLSLALTLLDNPELLLLDEPTNHMDIEMIEWLEKFLSQSHMTFIMVTHDRYFLDRVCNQIVELSESNIYSYPGNYSQFLEQKTAREQVARTEVDKARKLMKKEQEWINRMPKARTTKSKARIDSFEKTKEKANSLVTEKELKLQVAHSRIGGNILEMDHVTKRFGEKLLVDDFSYLFKKGDRIGILGKNGIGKSTLLNLITGKLAPDSGKILTGDTIVYGHYRQEGIIINEDQRVLDTVKEIAEIIPIGKSGSITASQFLHYFLFNAEMQNQLVSSLSGGEKRRLYLLTVLIKNPNFLILDEPTNDLDLMTLNKLEDFLIDFKGCLLLVSHDRYFLDKTVDHMFVFDGEGIISDFPGNYSQYRTKLDAVEKDEKTTIREEKKKTDESNLTKLTQKKKLSFSEKKEFESLEKEIEVLEEEKAKLVEFMDSGSQDYEALSQASVRISELMEAIDNKTLRWLELEELS